jgi:hypothetical protein
MKAGEAGREERGRSHDPDRPIPFEAASQVDAGGIGLDDHKAAQVTSRTSLNFRTFETGTP